MAMPSASLLLWRSQVGVLSTLAANALQLRKAAEPCRW